MNEIDAVNRREPYTPPADAGAGVDALYARFALAKAERQREVLADALRDAHARLVKIATLVSHDGVDMNEIYNTAYSGRARMALEKCGLLRPQDDPAMIPAAWLPGAEEGRPLPPRPDGKEGGGVSAPNLVFEDGGYVRDGSFWCLWFDGGGCAVEVSNPHMDDDGSGWWHYDEMLVDGRPATDDERADYGPAVQDDLREMRRWA